jgi:hypothetical protein
MDTNLTSAIERFFREHGFEMTADASANAYSLSGTKGAVSAFVQLGQGRREKGRPLVYAVPLTLEREPDDVVRPMLHVPTAVRAAR